MSYSHSWYRDKEIDPTVMSLIVADFIQLRKNLPEKAELVDAPDFWGGLGDIAFGGKAVSCEPMIFCRVSSGRCITQERAREQWQVGRYFEFCKTEKLPYDLAVKSLLIIVKNHVAAGIRIFTDGNNDDWTEAQVLCHDVLGYGGEFSIKERELFKSVITYEYHRKDNKPITVNELIIILNREVKNHYSVVKMLIDEEGNEVQSLFGITIENGEVYLWPAREHP